MTGMCGIAGAFGAEIATQELPALLERMLAAMAHRGPDDSGVSVSPEIGAGLACRRLSLVDLVTGHQPIATEDGRVLVVMNGEIYNHRELRAGLEQRGHRFRTSSDTEVVVHAYEEEGVDCLARLNGMFGLAVLDLAARTLLLARDAAGMKPLYWTRISSGYLFASEAKALFASGLVSPEANVDALATYLAVGYNPAPRTCFRGIERIPPGEYVVIEAGGVRRGTFWRMRFDHSGRVRGDRECAEELDATMRAAVKAHLDADVPVGAFVSGGLDSSLVAAYAAPLSSRPLKTFSLVFPEDPDIDESRFSRRLTAQLGTDHHEVEFRSCDLPGLLEKAVRHLEEPCSAGPALLTFHLASAASRHVKAVLSGEGSDELFAGYRWLRSEGYYRLRAFAARPLARALLRFAAEPRRIRALSILAAEDDARADAEWFRAFTPRIANSLLRPEWRSALDELAPLRLDPATAASCAGRLERRLALEFTRRLPEGILFFGDKMSMAHSLEVRMPFLDRQVIEFALALPSHLKIRDGREKYILSLLDGAIPEEIRRRRKAGLHYPERMLLSGKNKVFARDLMMDSGLFLERRLGRFLERALAGPGEQTRLVWMLLLLAAWRNEFFPR